MYSESSGARATARAPKMSADVAGPPSPAWRPLPVPANVVMTAQAIALERRVPYEQFEASIEASAAAVFGW